MPPMRDGPGEWTVGSGGSTSELLETSMRRRALSFSRTCCSGGQQTDPTYTESLAGLSDTESPLLWVRRSDQSRGEEPHCRQVPIGRNHETTTPFTVGVNLTRTLPGIMLGQPLDSPRAKTDDRTLLAICCGRPSNSRAELSASSLDALFALAPPP